MKPGSEQRPPRKASDFDEIVDRLAGIGPREPLEVTEEEDGSATPLSPEMIANVVAEVSRLQAQNGDRGHRRWWLRPAALIPCALALLGAVPAYVIWDVRDAKTLSYENAQHVVFDYTNSEMSRNVAMGRIVNTMLRGITEIRRAAVRDPKLATDAKAVCAAIRGLVENPALAKNAQQLASGTLQGIVDSVEVETSTAAQRRSFVRFVSGCKSGFQILHRAMLEKGFLGKQSRLRIRLYKRWIEQKLPADKTGR